jgi:hypothetical protein
MIVQVRVLVVGAIVFLAMPTAVAQYTAAAVAALNGDDAGIVLGQPCTAAEKTVEITPLADGTKIIKRTEVRKWRDSQGRFRKEKAQVEDGQEPVFEVATILDPVSEVQDVDDTQRPPDAPLVLSQVVGGDISPAE